MRPNAGVPAADLPKALGDADLGSQKGKGLERLPRHHSVDENNEHPV